MIRVAGMKLYATDEKEAMQRLRYEIDKAAYRVAAEYAGPAVKDINALAEYLKDQIYNENQFC